MFAPAICFCVYMCQVCVFVCVCVYLWCAYTKYFKVCVWRASNSDINLTVMRKSCVRNIFYIHVHTYVSYIHTYHVLTFNICYVFCHAFELTKFMDY